MEFGTSTLVFFMLLLIAVLAVCAKLLRQPYPIVFVIGGGLLALIPGLPRVELQSDLIFLLILPPLLFGGGFTTEFRDFKRYLTPILMMAIGLVIFTTTAVAYAAHALMAIPLAVAFVLGAIVAPPDAVAAEAIGEQLSLPRRLKAILGGESLINDATSLVILRFAIVAVATGAFSLLSATVQFVYVSVAGIAVGVFVCMLIMRTVKWLRSRNLSDSTINVTISLVTPFLVYFPAEAIHASGILATVSAGVVMSRKLSDIFDSESRIAAAGVWNLLFFTFNGVVFILIGLQLRSVVANLAGRYSLYTLIWYGLAISAIVIAVRFAWLYPATYLRRRWIPGVRRHEGPDPRWQEVFILSWAGMRGIVTLAAALALPQVLGNGQPFPDRDLVVFLAFSVIVVTLLGQGLTLPPLIRLWNIRDDESPEEALAFARVAAARAGRDRLAALEPEFATSVHWEVAGRIRAYYEQRMSHYQTHVEKAVDVDADALEHQIDRDLRRATYDAERAALVELRHTGDIGDEVFRELQWDIDLAEQRLG
jgi:monovalent cation/hydrogen antiporter